MASQINERVGALLEQRKAVIDFGRTALKSDSRDEILQRACELCRTALGTEFAKVMRVEENGRTLRVIAGVGWKDGVVGEEVVPALAGSSEGFALSLGRPAVTHNIDEEEQFDYPKFLERHDVKSLLNVIIPGGDENPPYGLLQVDSTQTLEFAQEDIEFLQSYANILGAAIERLDKSEALARANTEKDRAFHELQHRVGNYLTVLKSLVRTRNRRAEHPAIKQETALFLGQIESLSALHEQLTAASNIDEVDIGGLLSNLCSTIGSFASEGDAICKVVTRTETVIVDSGAAIPLGIITNEFMTNSLKHAMRDDLCTVHLTVASEHDHVFVEMRDEGQGLGDARTRMGDENTGSGLGFIDALVDQIGAEATWSDDGGARLQIRIPLSRMKVLAKT